MLWLTVLALMVVVVVLELWRTNDYSLTPGNATPVAPLVRIHGVEINSHHDQIMLADVFEQQLTVWKWLEAHLQSHIQIVSSNSLEVPGVSPSELDAQGFLEMSDAKKSAEAAAFRAVGWLVPATSSGTVVTSVGEHSPASAAGLHVGDDIVAFNGAPIRSSCQLIGAVHNVAARTHVTLRVDAATFSSTGRLSYKPASSVRLVTATAPADQRATGCPGVSGPAQSWLGVSLENDVHYQLPATVSINTANIGGPSAGLAMTLTLINKLSGGSLTGHHVIAATGTMDAQGNVGAVGGVEEKAVAVHRAGASYFFVPDADGDVAAARDAHQPGLTIVPVTTLAQVLKDLRRLGGAAPKSLTKPS